MLQKYKTLANAALGVAAVGIGLAVYFDRDSTNGNIWGPGGAPEVLGYVIAAGVYLAFWAYAKAKGRSGWLGLLLPLLNVVGLIILLCLKDHSERPPEKACPGCSGKNLANDSHCRYCGSALSAPAPGA